MQHSVGSPDDPTRTCTSASRVPSSLCRSDFGSSRRPDVLTGTSDETAFDHDALGRMTQVTQTGITLPGSSTPASVEVTYNEVGEQIKVSQPLTTSTALDRYWTYDAAGRQATYRDAGGTTTNTYNRAGWLLSTDDPRPSLTVHQGYDRLGRPVRGAASGLLRTIEHALAALDDREHRGERGRLFAPARLMCGLHPKARLNRSHVF